MKISVSIARDQEMNAEVDNELAVDELAEQFSNPLSASSVRFFRLLVAQISRDYRIELSREDCFKATALEDAPGHS